MNMRFGPKQRLIIAGAAGALILGFGGWGFLRLAARVWQRDFILGELRSKTEKMRGDRELADDLALILERRRSDLDRISAVFVNRARPVAFIETLEGLASSSGNKIAIDIIDQKSDERHLGFRLTVEGEDQNLLRYVRLLETLAHKLEMEEAVFQKNLPDPSAGRPSTASHLILSFRVSAR